MPKKEVVKEVTPKLVQTLVDQVNKLEENVELNNKEIKEKVEFINENINRIKEEITIYRDQTKETIRTQEDIIMSMVHKFNDQFLIEKNKIISDLETVKTQFDVMKISFTVNENQLLEKLRNRKRYPRATVKDIQKFQVMLELSNN